MQAIKNAISAFLEAYSRKWALRVSEGNDVRVWTPPSLGVIKVNVDANWKRVDEGCHIRIVMRDYGSRCLTVRRMRICASSALMAEAREILEGCVMAWQRGYSCIVVKSDSKAIITWLNDCIKEGSWHVFRFCARSI